MFIRKPKTQSEEPYNPNELFERYEDYVTQLTSAQWKRNVIVGLIVSAVLITAASLPFTFISTWVYAIVGSPAGIILFLLGLGAVYRTSMKDWGLFQLRETRSFRNRVRIFSILGVLFLAIFIPTGHYVPYGVGGSILIILVLSAITSLRRTDIEREYVKQGIPDPRDILEDRLADEDEPTVQRESQASAPNPGKTTSGKIQ